MSSQEKSQATQELVLLAVARFQKYFALFCDLANRESEGTFEAFADWIHNLEILRDTFWLIQAAERSAWEDWPHLARCVHPVSVSVQRCLNRVENNLRHCHFTLASSTPAFLHRELIAPLSCLWQPLGKLLAWIKNLRQEAVDFTGDDGPLVEFWKSRPKLMAEMPSFEQAYAWELGEFEFVLNEGHSFDICRTLRRLVLLHFAWGAVLPQQWTSHRADELQKKHEQVRSLSAEEVTCRDALKYRLRLLQIDRTGFAKQAARCITHQPPRSAESLLIHSH